MLGVEYNTVRGWLEGKVPSREAFNQVADRLGRTVQIDPADVKALSESYERTVADRHVDVFGLSPERMQIALQEVAQRLARANIPPSPPVQTSPGPTLGATGAGFDIQIKSPPETERNDPLQVALHSRLQTRARRLESAMSRISNTHAMLADEFRDYCRFLSADLIDLNVAVFWSAGTGVSEHILAIDQAGPTAMMPALEPDIAAELHAMMNDHTAFIMGFADGRELHQRVVMSREAAQKNPDMQVQTQAALRPMITAPHLLAEQARVLVQSLVRALGSTTSATFTLLASSSNMTYSTVVAFARVLHPILLAGEAANLALLFAGHEHAEVLTAAVIYLRDNMQVVSSVFAHDPQVASWLAWVVQRLHDFPEA